MPPFHDPLYVGLLDVTHKLHVRLKTYVILIKPAVPKMLGEVCAGGVREDIEATKASLVAISGKKKMESTKKKKEKIKKEDIA